MNSIECYDGVYVSEPYTQSLIQAYPNTQNALPNPSAKNAQCPQPYPPLPYTGLLNGCASVFSTHSSKLTTSSVSNSR
jgi:hypothetical protein